MSLLRISPEYVPPALPDPSPLKYLLMPTDTGTTRGTSAPFKGLGDIFDTEMKDVKMLPGAAADYMLALYGNENEYAQAQADYQAKLAVAGPQNLRAIQELSNQMIGPLRKYITTGAAIRAEKAKQELNFENWSKISQSTDPDFIMADGDGNPQFDPETGNPIRVGDYLYYTSRRGIGAFSETPYDDTIPEYKHPDSEYLFNEWNKIMKAAAKNNWSEKTTQLTGTDVVTIGNEQYHVLYNQSETTGRTEVDPENKIIMFPSNYDQLQAAYEIFLMKKEGDSELKKAYNYTRGIYAYNRSRYDAQDGGASQSDEDYASEFDNRFFQNSIKMNEILEYQKETGIQTISKGDGGSGSDRSKGANVFEALYRGDAYLGWTKDALSIGTMTEVTSKAPGELEDEYPNVIGMGKNPTQNPIKSVTDGVTMNVGGAWEKEPALFDAVLKFNGLEGKDLAAFNSKFGSAEERELAVRNGLYNYYWKQTFGQTSDISTLPVEEKKRIQQNRDRLNEYMKYYFDKELFDINYEEAQDPRKRKELGESFGDAFGSVGNALLRAVGLGETPEQEIKDVEMTEEQKKAIHQKLVTEGRTKLSYDEWSKVEPTKSLDISDPFAFVDYLKYTDYLYKTPAVYPIQWTQIPSDMKGGRGAKEMLTYQMVTQPTYMPGGKQLANVPMMYYNPQLVVKGFPDMRPDGTMSSTEAENKILGTVAMTKEAWDKIIRDNGNTVTIGNQVFNLNKKKHREMLGIYTDKVRASEFTNKDVFRAIKNNLMVEDSGDFDVMVVPVVTGGKILITQGWNIGNGVTVEQSADEAVQKAQREQAAMTKFLTTEP